MHMSTIFVEHGVSAYEYTTIPKLMKTLEFALSNDPVFNNVVYFFCSQNPSDNQNSTSF